MQANRLSNVQREILKLYSTELSEKDIYELKSQLAHYYARKAISQADKIWAEKGYTAEDMDSWFKWVNAKLFWTLMCLVSISSKSPYHCIFKKLINGAYDLGTTTETLMEYEEVIERKFNSEVAKDTIRTLLALPNVKKINVYFNWNLIEADSDDNKFVDCAVSANASGIVIQDKHFNVLRDIDFPNITLISIADFKLSLSWDIVIFKWSEFV